MLVRAEGIDSSWDIQKLKKQYELRKQIATDLLGNFPKTLTVPLLRKKEPLDNWSKITPIQTDSTYRQTLVNAISSFDEQFQLPYQTLLEQRELRIKQAEKLLENLPESEERKIIIAWKKTLEKSRQDKDRNFTPEALKKLQDMLFKFDNEIRELQNNQQTVVPAGPDNINRLTRHNVILALQNEIDILQKQHGLYVQAVEVYGKYSITTHTLLARPGDKRSMTQADLNKATAAQAQIQHISELATTLINHEGRMSKNQLRTELNTLKEKMKKAESSNKVPPQRKTNPFFIKSKTGIDKIIEQHCKEQKSGFLDKIKRLRGPGR